MEQFPALTYHYGLSLEELVSMPRVFIELYIRKLPGLMAEEQLLRIEAATHPHAKQDAQKRTIRDHERIIKRSEPYRSQERTAPATDQSPIVAQRQLGAIGIGMRIVDADGKPVVAGEVKNA